MFQNSVYVTGQFVGVAALIVAFISFQQKSQKRIVFVQFLSSILFTIHFFMISAYVGALLNGIGILRAGVFMNKDRRWAQSKIWLWLFNFICIAAVILTCDGNLNLTTWNISLSSPDFYISLLPMVGMILTTLAFWIEDPAKVRRISLPSSPCWMTYNLYHHSWAGACSDLFVMTSILIAMFRYDFKRSHRENAAGKDTQE